MERHSLIPYIGGKFRQAPWIISLFPPNYTDMCYLEPFAGGLSVFMLKSASKVEVINDLYEDVINLYRVIREDGERLAEAADSLLYSRKIYNDLASEWYKGERPRSDFNKALIFFYLARTSFSGKNHERAGWGYSSQKNQALDYRRAIEEIEWISNRLRYTQVECNDFESCVKAYDSSNTLIYCDPPFVGTEGHYGGCAKFTEEDHLRLAELLNGCSGKVLLSYYDDPLIRDLYTDDKWHYHTRHSAMSCEGSVRKSKGNKKKTRQELLITNYTTKFSFFEI